MSSSGNARGDAAVIGESPSQAEDGLRVATAQDTYALGYGSPSSEKAAEIRRLLVVAYHYPPENTSTGVLRTLKFTQYLGNHGWHSHVISVPESLYRVTDPESAKRIPSHVRVHRVWAADIAKSCSIRGVYPGALAFPDRYWPWLFAAARKGGELVRDKGVDALYSTYPMPTAHLIALWLKRRYGLPWIADFRDPWVENSIPLVRRKAEGFLERAVVRNADRVICTTPAMTRFLARRYHDLPQEKFVTIPNGYDEADFRDLVPTASADFEILYPGTISGSNRNPEPLFRAIRLALDRGWLDRNDLKLTFLGCGPYGLSDAFQDTLDRYRLREHTELVIKRIPYSAALKRLANASVLVVLSEVLGTGSPSEVAREWARYTIPAKIYEYLRLGRPTLILGTGDALAELLRDTGAAALLSPTDTEGTALELRDHYANRTSTTAGTRAALMQSVARYNRERLTELLARELNALCGSRKN
jgi:glycosyltransferase involved in cell wall biosynthesis